jgi:hypothetical protein
MEKKPSESVIKLIVGFDPPRSAWVLVGAFSMSCRTALSSCLAIS